MEEIKMKKFRKMKKNNKGFSLVELIVVIAIMAVLVGVLGSAILGYIEDANYESDRTALKSVETAIEAYVAEGGVYSYSENTLKDFLSTQDKDSTVSNAIAEIFKDGKFEGSSEAFEGITTEDVKIAVTQGNVYVFVESNSDDFDDYESGVKPTKGEETPTEKTE